MPVDRRPFRLTSLAALPLLALAVAAGAEEDPHAACAAMGWVPREILERPLGLRPGVGNAHEAVTTSSSDAQAFYDQGLNYLHGYVWIEAARSFRQALRLDPELAMAYVGLSRVYTGLDDSAAATKALGEAESRSGKVRDWERRRIALRGKQLEALADLADTARHLAYKKAIDEALAADVGDAELWLLRGNAEEPTAAGRGQRGGAASTAFYQEALRISPDNAAAHHYLIHSYETISQIPPALEHGEAYARLAPSIPHSHHMWGHDLRRVGKIDEAIAAFRRTDALEKAYYAAEGIPPGLDWHHVHNLDLLGTAYQHKGQMRRAEETLREAEALPPVTEYQEFNNKTLAVFLLGRARWEEGLESARALAAGKWPSTRAVGQALSGNALLALGRKDEARKALEAAQREALSVPALAGGVSISRAAVQPWVDTLLGESLLRDGKTAEGSAMLVDVEKRLRALPGPDAWSQALFRLEAIARIAREVGDWELAEHTARQMLEHDGAYGGSHLAQALVEAHNHERAKADESRAAAAARWGDADPDLPELALLRSVAAGR